MPLVGAYLTPLAQQRQRRATLREEQTPFAGDREVAVVLDGVNRLEALLPRIRCDRPRVANYH